MRHLGTAVTLIIVLFWGVMNTLLVHRQRRLDELGLYQRRVNHFLGTSPRRERWIGVYRKSGGKMRKMGYSGTIHEKVPGIEGTEYRTELEAVLETTLFGAAAEWLSPLVGRGRVRLRGDMTQDADLLPLRLHLEILLPNGVRLTVQGRRVASGGGDATERFGIVVRGAGVDLPPVALPLRTLELGGPLVPNLPLAGLREGEEIEIATFNPVVLRREVTKIKVTDVTTRDIGSVLVDVYELDLDVQGVHASALLTRDGNLVRMKLGEPFDGVVIRSQTEREARLGFLPEGNEEQEEEQGSDG